MENCQAIVGNKIKCKSQIALAEDNNLATDDTVLAETFNKFFVNVAVIFGINYEKLQPCWVNYKIQGPSNYTCYWTKIHGAKFNFHF